MKKIIFVLFTLSLIFNPIKLKATENYSLSIIDPSGSEVYYPEDTIRINWEQENIDKVKIYLQLEPGNVLSITSDMISVDKNLTSSFYDWVIPENILEPGEIEKNDLKIQIIAYDSNIGSVVVYSNNFSIISNEPYLNIYVDPNSPQGNLSYSQDLLTAKFKLQAQGGNLEVNNINIYLRKGSADYFGVKKNLKVIDSTGNQINATNDYEFSTINFVNPIFLNEGETKTISVSIDPYLTFPYYSGEEFSLCAKYLPSNTGNYQGVSSGVGAICANSVTTNEWLASSDLKILSVSTQPAMMAETFNLAVYYQGPLDPDFTPYKIRLINKKDNTSYYADVINKIQNHVDFLLPFGSYQGEFMIDSDNVITENNEDNNIFFKNFAYCGANQSANCEINDNSLNDIILIVSSKDDYYGGKNRTYYEGDENIILMDLDLLNTSENTTLDDLYFAPFNKDSFLENLVNIRLINNGKEIAFVDKTFAASYWSDPNQPKVPGYIQFKNIDLLLQKNQPVNLQVTAELGASLTKTQHSFSYSLNSLGATLSNGEKISYSSASLDVNGQGNLPIKGLNTIIKQKKTTLSDENISNVIIKSITADSVIVKWTSKDSDISSILYGVKNSQNDINMVAKDKKQKTEHTLLISNLSPDTKYYLKILSNSLSDSLIESEVYEFTTINNNLDDDSSKNHSVLQLQRKISALERQVIDLEKKLTKLDQTFIDKHPGTMFLDVENHGRLWYVDPESKNRFYFEDGASALSISSKLATGITYENIQKIPVGISDKLYNLIDSDNDGLSDRLETSLGSDPNRSDTDSDGYSDKQELENGYDPLSNKKYIYSQNLINRLEGKMLLQVSGPNSHGEIWYIKDGKRWYGGTGDSMYEIMKSRSLGATATDIRKIGVGDVLELK